MVLFSATNPGLNLSCQFLHPFSWLWLTIHIEKRTTLLYYNAKEQQSSIAACTVNKKGHVGDKVAENLNSMIRIQKQNLKFHNKTIHGLKQTKRTCRAPLYTFASFLLFCVCRCSTIRGSILALVPLTCFCNQWRIRVSTSTSSDNLISSKNWGKPRIIVAVLGEPVRGVRTRLNRPPFLQQLIQKVRRPW